MKGEIFLIRHSRVQASDLACNGRGGAVAELIEDFFSLGHFASHLVARDMPLAGLKEVVFTRDSYEMPHAHDMGLPRAVGGRNALSAAFAKRREQCGFAAGADEIDIEVDLGHGNHEVVFGHSGGVGELTRNAIFARVARSATGA